MIFCCKCPPTVHFVAKKDNRLAAHNDMYGRVLFIKKVNLHNKIYHGHCLVVIAVVAAAVAAAASPHNNKHKTKSCSRCRCAAMPVEQAL